MKFIKVLFWRIKYLLKKYSGKGAFSIGIGGLISLFIIEYCRFKLIPFFTGTNALYNFIVDNKLEDITNIEFIIMFISIIAIIFAPLLTKRNSKKMFKLTFIVLLLFFESVCFVSIIINPSITKPFILLTTITFISLVWFSIDILKVIYSWTKIDKSKENQVDVTKLTFIWAIIVFILGLLR